MNEEERDLEQELKEEKDRFERQNQEAYDKEVSGEAELKRQEEKRIRKGQKRRYQRLQRKQTQTGGNTGEKFIPDKTGDFAPAPDRDMRTGEPIYDPETDQFGNPVSGFQGNLGASIAFEVGANTLLDLFSPVLPLQSGGSYVINLISQIIRDPSKIGSLNQLEAGAAATSSLIPGANQYAAFLKGIKPATRGTQVVRQLGRGIVDANINLAGERIGSGQEITAEDVAIATGIGGSLGVFIPRIAEEIGKDPTDFSKIFRNIRKRLDGGPELITPEGVNLGQATPEFEPTSVFEIRKSGFSDDAQRKIDEIQKELRVNRPQGDQLGLFTNEGDKFLYEKYKKQNRVIQTPDPTRQQASRVLRPTDFDIFLEEDPNITIDHVLGYIESVKAAKSGKPVLNPATNRFIRNQKGLDGTLRFLNEKAAPSAKFNLNDIADELSAEFNTTITPADISNMIKGNVKEGVVSFKTQGMSQPMQLKSIADLRKVYMARVARYKDIPAFERGHVFAADNIIKDKRISNLTDFKNNLEPEIARSIYRQLDDEALEELIRLNVDADFDNIESLYEQVLAGNRSRRNVDDPDKVIAALYGRDYGLRESFLNYVYPNRSLGRLITADSKAAFADLYKKELAQRLTAYQGLSIGPDALDKIRADVAKEVLKSFPDVDSRFVIEQMTLASDKAYLKDMVDPNTGEAK